MEVFVLLLLFVTTWTSLNNLSQIGISGLIGVKSEKFAIDVTRRSSSTDWSEFTTSRLDIRLKCCTAEGFDAVVFRRGGSWRRSFWTLSWFHDDEK